MSMGRVKYEDMKVLVALSNVQLAEFIWHFLKDNRVGNVQLAPTLQTAVGRMRDTPFTHFFLDYDFGEHGGVDFARFIRMCDGPMGEAPITMIIPNPDRTKVFGARDNGVNEILGLPLTAKLIEARLSHMTKFPKPFVRAASYIGPCRRRDPAQIYHGNERRNGRGDDVRLVLATSMA